MDEKLKKIAMDVSVKQFHRNSKSHGFFNRWMLSSGSTKGGEGNPETHFQILNCFNITFRTFVGLFTTQSIGPTFFVPY